MFKIYDGREHFFQWDLNQKLVIADITVTEVHFCNKTDNCSLVCEVYDEDGLRVVNVPNLLFQTAWDIRAYAYCEMGYTKAAEKFRVVERTKPADYVYTETEVLSYKTLDERVKALEASGGNGGTITVDQTYNPDSIYAQSGTAVAEAVATKMDKFGEVTKEDDYRTTIDGINSDLKIDVTQGHSITLTAGKLVFESSVGGIDFITEGKGCARFAANGKLQLVSEPEDETDAANKGYVDTKIGDIDTALDAIIELQNSIIGG